MQVLHTTAAYLPDDLTAAQATAFTDLVRAMPLLYPGDGGKLMGQILADTLVQSELDAVASPEDAQLLVWKLHNAVAAEASPARSPFPHQLAAKMKLSTADFRVVTRGPEQLMLGALTGRARCTCCRRPASCCPVLCMRACNPPYMNACMHTHVHVYSFRAARDTGRHRDALGLGRRAAGGTRLGFSV